MLIDKRTTRVILDTGTPTEITFATSRPNVESTALTSMISSSAIYVGFYERFKSRYFHIGSVVNAIARTMTVSYWDGSAWTALDDVVNQTLDATGTKPFARSGFISWEGQSDWALSEVSPVTVEMYWIKITLSGALTTGTLLDSIINIFVDDTLLSQYFPEFIYDTDYLPPGKTNFLEQYLAASNLIATYLERNHQIENIAEIIEPSEVSLAAVHAAKYIILNGIPHKSEELLQEVADAKQDMEREINGTTISTDADLSGEIDDTTERDLAPIYVARR